MEQIRQQLLTMNSNKLNTETSNWIDQRIMVGAYPAHQDPNKCNEILTVLYNSRINVIVSLQEFGEDAVFTKYKDIYGSNAQYYQFPIKDRHTLPKNQLIQIINSIIYILQDQTKTLYIHCHGGFGRTGLISTLLLKAIYNISNNDALDLWYSLRDTRVKTTISKNGKKGNLTNIQIFSLNEF